MTTYFSFTPTRQIAPQFQPTLDGQQYTCVVVWPVFSQRYYIACYALDGTLVFYLPVMGSATGVNIQSLTWTYGVVTLVTVDPHGYAIGATVNLTISNSSPAGYNGVYRCFVTDPSTITFSLSTNPGAATQFGVISYDINICGGYFNSTLVYRAANSQFEVSP